MDLDIDLEDLTPETRGVLKKLVKDHFATHHNGPLNRVVPREMPMLSEKGVLIATNHRRTGKNILAIDMTEAAKYPNFDMVFEKEIDALIKTLKKGRW